MQSTTWFCNTCGAANDRGQTLCFACRQPHVEHTQPAASPDLFQGRYRLLTQVGLGGFGVVYKALDTQFAERVVAVKQINLRGLTPQKMIEATDTFNREVHILPQLKHPNLPRVYDQFTDPDHWYLVMEFLEGQTLERYMEARLRQRFYTGTTRLLSLDEILALAFQLCDVLDYLHTRQPPIIFRDLKPANIMCTGMGHLFLIDFGIARLFTPGKARDTTPLGSPGYAAPEQYGKAQTSPRSDLYSLGALLHHLATGDEPSETPFQFAPLPPTDQAAMQKLDALIVRLVDVESSQRPASAREVKEELQHIALLAASAGPHIWFPPQGQTPDPEVVQSAFNTGQQQIQAQIQKQKGTTRRKLITRSLVGGGALILGVGVLGPALINLLNDNSPGPRDFTGFSRPFREQESISDITWSPDGQQAAFISTINSVQNGSGSTNTSVIVYPVEQVSDASSFNGPAVISALAWAPEPDPDTRHIALGFADGSISVYDTGSASPVFTYPDTGSTSPVLTYHGSIGQVKTIAWSPDGKLIASGGMQEVVRICQASNGKIVSTYPGDTFNVTRLLSWSPDSTRVVIESNLHTDQLNDPTLQVWDVGAGKTLFTFAQTNMLKVAWSPNGKLIVSVGNVGYDENVYLWNASDGTFFKAYPAQSSSNIDQSPVELLWSPASDYIALDDGGRTLKVWNVQNDALKLVPINLGNTRAMIWLHDGHIALIDADRNTQFIDMRSL
ncbi:MAG: hypothetical protein NVS3B14_02890 [Ktedonobacteraceae bacterium]